MREESREMDNAARAHRQQNSLLVLAKMHDWLVHLRVATSDNSGLARAIDYSLNRWPT